MAKRQRPPPEQVDLRLNPLQVNHQLRTRQSVHFRLPLDVLDRLAAQASVEGKDKTALVVDSLVEYFKRNPVKMGRKR